jgi:hypothetical protein
LIRIEIEGNKGSKIEFCGVFSMDRRNSMSISEIRDKNYDENEFSMRGFKSSKA